MKKNKDNKNDKDNKDNKEKIRIGIDINEANVVNRVGSNQYAYEILKALHSIDNTNQYTLYSSKPLVKDLPKAKKNWQYKVIPPAKLWTQWRLPLELIKDRNNLDVFYSPGHYAPRFSPIPTVVTIMDLAFLLFPKFFKKKDTNQLTNWTRYSIKKASSIIAISKSTKKDIQRYYGTPAEKIKIAYPGHSSQSPIKINQQVLSKYKLSKDYILFVGTIQPRKNIVRLIQAFDKLTGNHHLVIAGKKGWIYKDVQKAIENSSKKDKIHQLGFVPNSDLTSLIKKASCLVLPGLYEGFGIPPLEAINLGTIPVVSYTGSLPEVVGEKGLFFDPFSVDSISKALQNAIKLTPARKKAYISKLKAHTNQFSWASSARIILEVIHEVAI